MVMKGSGIRHVGICREIKAHTASALFAGCFLFEWREEKLFCEEAGMMAFPSFFLFCFYEEAGRMNG